MTISTLDGALAGMQPPIYIAKGVTPTLVAGRPHSLWYLAGAPGAGTMDNTTSGGVALSSSSAIVAGQIYHKDPTSGTSYLARLQAMCTQPGTLILADRLWHGSDIIGGTVISVTATTSQTITSVPTWPARDANGATAGVGVLIGLEVYTTATTGGSGSVTLTYTNTAGTTGKTSTTVDVPGAAQPGAFFRFGLASGDLGVKTPTAIQNSASWTAGTFGLVAYRVLATLELTVANVPNAIDALTSGFPQLPNGAVPFLIFVPNTTTASNISGSFIETQG